MAATRQLPALSLEAAKIAADAAEQKAKQMGMDFTAAGHRAPTSVYAGQNFLPGGPAFGIHNTNGGRLTSSVVGCRLWSMVSASGRLELVPGRRRRISSVRPPGSRPWRRLCRGGRGRSCRGEHYVGFVWDWKR